MKLDIKLIMSTFRLHAFNSSTVAILIVIPGVVEVNIGAIGATTVVGEGVVVGAKVEVSSAISPNRFR